MGYRSFISGITITIGYYYYYYYWVLLKLTVNLQLFAITIVGYYYYWFDGFNPSEKYELVSWDHCSQLNGKS